VYLSVIPLGTRETTNMETVPPTPSTDLGQSPARPFRRLLADAVRFWEPRRLLYNLLLTIVVGLWLVGSWPHFRPALTWPTLIPLSFLAFLANVCYSAAYLVDIPMQSSSPCTTRNRLRWALWLIGTLFAILLENYWIADEIFPDFH
jgi:hypothetical protein